MQLEALLHNISDELHINDEHIYVDIGPYLPKKLVLLDVKINYILKEEVKE